MAVMKLRKWSFSGFRYTRLVRRALSLVLLLAFSLPLLLPALALAQGPDANLPLCCRKNGKHHCAMMAGTTTPKPGVNASAVPQRCPFYPALVTPQSHLELASPLRAAAFAEIVNHPALRPQTEARARIALDCARHKRGPPSHLL
jgi:hypothetical protein